MRWGLRPQEIMKRLAAILALACSSAACDLATFPETAQFDNAGAASLDLTVTSRSMPEDGVQAVELTFTEVVMHRVSDDAWVIVGDESTSVAFDGPTSVMAIEGAPFDRETYDAIALRLGRVRVAADGVWRVADIEGSTIEIDVALASGGDASVELVVHLGASLWGDAEAGWTFAPAVELGPLAPSDDLAG